MALDPQLLEWIQQKEAEGFTEEEIYRYLQRHDYGEEESKEALTFIREGKTIIHTPEKKKAPMWMWAAIITGFLIIIIVGFFATNLQTIVLPQDEKQPSTQEQQAPSDQEKQQSAEEQAQAAASSRNEDVIPPFADVLPLEQESTNKTGQGNKSEPEEEFNSTLALPTPEALSIGISMSEQLFSINDSLQGSNYEMEYDGQRFQGVVIYSVKKDLYSPQTLHVRKNWFDNINFAQGRTNNLQVDLKPVTFMNETDVEENEMFVEQGTYVYYMSVYDCYSIEMYLKQKSCGGEIDELPLFELQTAIDPVAQTDFPIIVI